MRFGSRQVQADAIESEVASDRGVWALLDYQATYLWKDRSMATKSRRPKSSKAQAGSIPPSFPLAEEVRTYEAHLPQWSDREGQFVLIRDREVVGFYPSDEQALEAGYEQFGPGPFLVKQILAHEPTYQLGHVKM